MKFIRGNANRPRENVRTHRCVVMDQVFVHVDVPEQPGAEGNDPSKVELLVQNFSESGEDGNEASD